MSRPVPTGDDLDRMGAKGENHLEKLCLDAGLKFSKVQPDKTGKDYIVEFDLEPPGHTPLDRRPPPLQIVVQVKTILAKNDSAKVSLSVAERLAKDTRPAIILIFKIDENFDIVDLFFVHLVDSPLATILHALRRASLKQSPRLNHMSVSFRTKRALRVENNWPAFRTAISKIPGSGMLEYAANKARQLDELGFPPQRHLMKFDLSSIDSDALADGFLALAPIDVENLVVAERRFNIDIPIEGPRSARLIVEPATHAIGKIVIDDNGSLRVEADAEYTFATSDVLGEGRYAISARTKYGRVVIKKDKWSFVQAPEFSQVSPHPLEDWKNFLKLAVIFGGGQFRFNLHREGIEDAAGFNVVDPGAGFDVTVERRLIERLKMVETVLQAAGAMHATLSLDDILGDVHVFRILSRTLTKVSASFEATDIDTRAPSLLEEQGGFFSAVEVLPRLWVGLLVPVSLSSALSGNETKWTATQTRKAVAEVLDIGDLEASFDRFYERFCELLGIRVALVQRPGEFDAKVTALIDSRDNVASAVE
jgi:hypothetical protein